MSSSHLRPRKLVRADEQRYTANQYAVQLPKSFVVACERAPSLSRGDLKILVGRDNISYVTR